MMMVSINQTHVTEKKPKSESFFPNWEGYVLSKISSIFPLHTIVKVLFSKANKQRPHGVFKKGVTLITYI